METACIPVKRAFLSLVALLSLISNPLEGFLGPRTLILPRSQSVNAARDLVGWQQEIHRYNPESNYWVFAFTPEYTHTFNNNHLVDQIFGSECFTVTGSAVPYRKPTDLLADHFELPRDYEGTISVSPYISQFIADFNWFIGLDQILKGLFFIVHFPVVSSKWDVGFDECVSVAGAMEYPAGYYSDSAIPRTSLLRNMRQYLGHDRTVGDVEEPLQYQKVIGLTGRNVESGLSDVQGALGYDFARGEGYHVGLEVRAYAPAGNRPSPQYIFNAVVGNGHHWELGGGFTSHCRIWHDGIHSILFYLDANVTHLFKSGSKRSFNLASNCVGSRYMMLEEIAKGSDGLFIYGDYPSLDEYVRRLAPGPNVTTLEVQTSFAVQGDVALKFAFYRNNMSVDVGYNFWGRSQEKMDCFASFEQNRYVLKGDAQIYGFQGYDSYYSQAIPLSASQRCATIFAGQGAGNFQPGLEFTNANADNPVQAFGESGDILVQLQSNDAAKLSLSQEPVMTSQPPIFLSCGDLDVNSVLVPTALTSKVFLHISNTWRAKKLDPFFGIGAEVEWAHGSGVDRGGISQWGIWSKMGLSY